MPFSEESVSGESEEMWVNYIFRENLKQSSIDSVLSSLVLILMKPSLVFKEMNRLKVEKKVVVSSGQDAIH